MKSYDIVIIGGGPGGYVAAIKAAQLGAKTALVEKEHIGGICLNWGCIPTKTLLRTAKLLRDMRHASEFGIDLSQSEGPKLNWQRMMNRKDKVVDQLVKGVEGLLEYNGVDVYEGTGRILQKGLVEVDGKQIEYKNLILATGSSPRMPSGIQGLREGYESGVVIDSTGALKLAALPKSIIVVGGGVIGVEFATLLNTLGTKVTILQRASEILNYLDRDVKALMQRHMKKHGVKIVTGADVQSIQGNEVVALVKGKEKRFAGDKILVSLGRVPNISGFEALNIETGPRGVATNGFMQTNVPNIYAIGDVNGKMMLAHVASAEGTVAVEHILGKAQPLNYDKIPSCIYSFPEVGAVGLTEDQARENAYDVVVSKFPLTANGKALAEGEAVGFVKIVADKTYGEVLGVHIIASHATDMIAEAAASMELEGTVQDLARTVHPHPTLSEIVMEAAQGAVDKPIHMIQK